MKLRERVGPEMDATEKKALCAGIPARDESRGTEDVDGVVPDAFDQQSVASSSVSDAW
jgi:hypothetical protein